MKGVTQKQQNILDFIVEFKNSEGMSPTVYEIADRFSIKTSTVFAHLRAMKRKELITRTSKARSIKVCGMDEEGDVIRLRGSRDNKFLGSAAVTTKNHAAFLRKALETMGCTEVVIEGVEG